MKYDLEAVTYDLQSMTGGYVWNSVDSFVWGPVIVSVRSSINTHISDSVGVSVWDSVKDYIDEI